MWRGPIVRRSPRRSSRASSTSAAEDAATLSRRRERVNEPHLDTRWAADSAPTWRTRGCRSGASPRAAQPPRRDARSSGDRAASPPSAPARSRLVRGRRGRAPGQVRRNAGPCSRHDPSCGFDRRAGRAVDGRGRRRVFVKSDPSSGLAAHGADRGIRAGGLWNPCRSPARQLLQVEAHEGPEPLRVSDPGRDQAPFNERLQDVPGRQGVELLPELFPCPRQLASVGEDVIAALPGPGPAGRRGARMRPGTRSAGRSTRSRS